LPIIVGGFAGQGTSRVDKIYPSETIIKIAGQTSKAMADQLTTVSEERFIEKIGFITNDEMNDIEVVIKLQLDIK